MVRSGRPPHAEFPLESQASETSDGSTSFVYDSENRLVSASGAKSAALVYDPLGRLFQTSGGSAGTTQFLYDGDALIAEYDGADARLRAYVNGPGMDTPLVWFEGTLAGRSLYADHQGSIVAMATPNGSYLAINAYDAWGIPNAGNVGRFAYTGQIQIPELGMYHYKARIYSPTLGRFLQTDPIGYDDQINLYAYVGNDPLNKYDSEGAWSRDVHNKIFERALAGRVTPAGIRVAQQVSLHQDIGSNANKMHMHYLRYPGQNPPSAIRQFKNYLSSELAQAKSEYAKGNENKALASFARAAHAIADYYSPAHRNGGNPAEYDPSWTPVEAALNGHSPIDAIGREGTGDLKPEVENRIVGETRKAFNKVFGDPGKAPLVSCTGSRIMRVSC